MSIKELFIRSKNPPQKSEDSAAEIRPDDKKVPAEKVETDERKGQKVRQDKKAGSDSDPKGGSVKKNDDRTSVAAQKSDIRSLVDHVIDEEERTFRNYINPRFWLAKRRDIQQIRKKEEHGLNIYEILAGGAAPSREYYILTVLSCIIATTGLVQGSTATIIGAMIVAPLMTPILAFSLGVIWGDLQLIRISVGSIAKGMFWAILISSAISFIIPLPVYSGEIMARTHPTLFDIIVALASGIVGAYGYANEKISNTLVGIAIAVALMPPLCTVGIGLGTMNREVASGAFILFIINLISIGLAGAVVFWAMKIHPPLADETRVARRAMYQIVLSVLILAAIAVPVSIFMYDDYQRVEAKEYARLAFHRVFPGLEILSLEAEEGKDHYSLRVVVTGSEEPERERILSLKKSIITNHPKISDMKIIFMKGDVLMLK